MISFFISYQGIIHLSIIFLFDIHTGFNRCHRQNSGARVWGGSRDTLHGEATLGEVLVFPFPAVVVAVSLARDHALDGAVLCSAEHVKGLLELFKVKAVCDERLHVHQLLG